MQMLNQKQKIIAIIGAIIIGIIMIYSYFHSTKEVYHYEEENLEADEEKEITEKQEESMMIHVTGAVKKQGIVEVKENARIYDVIEAAGGTIEAADLSRVNLAYSVEDGQKIYIPFEADGSNEVDDGETITKSAGENVIKEEKEQEGKSININTASVEKLQEIPGIGSVTAQKIITYRNENRKI